MKESPTQPLRKEDGLRQFLRWFKPGLKVKRWLGLILLGITLLGLGLAISLLDLYRTESTNPTLLTILSYASLRFLPRLLRVVIFGGLGAGLIVWGIMELNRSLLAPFLRPGRPMIEQISSFR